jgi:catechol 2,3-dioxygenase-like lactoylglutathione lyase family enzyme
MNTLSDIRASHVGIRTTDFEGLINWYIEKLDFRLIQKWNVGDLQLAYLAPANDNNFWIEILSIGSNEPEQAQSIVSGFQHLCFEVDNVDKTLAELNNRGVKTMREPFNVPVIGKRCGFIADLFGNVIELAESIK